MYNCSLGERNIFRNTTEAKEKNHRAKKPEPVKRICVKHCQFIF